MIENHINNRKNENSVSIFLNNIKSAFQDINSDFKFNKKLAEKELIGNVECFQISANSNAIIMPLEFQIKKFFEKDNNLEDMLNHMREIEENEKIVNFIQGDLWKQKKSLYPNKIVVPYFLYTDDFGINNPLGSKSNRHSMCNFYYSFPCLPKKSSKLAEVFLASSMKSADI